MLDIGEISFKSVWIIWFLVENILLICKVSLSPNAYVSAGEPIAASHWPSGSSQERSHWSNPEHWPAERGTVHRSMWERSSSTGASLSRASSPWSCWGWRARRRRRLWPSSPSSVLIIVKWVFWNKCEKLRENKHFHKYFRRQDLMSAQSIGRMCGQAFTPSLPSHLCSRLYFYLYFIIL